MLIKKNPMPTKFKSLAYEKNSLPIGSKLLVTI